MKNFLKKVLKKVLKKSFLLIKNITLYLIENYFSFVLKLFMINSLYS